MYCKLLNEDGEYRDAITKEPCNLLTAENWVATPDGLNTGWMEFNSVEEAVTELNIEKI